MKVNKHLLIYLPACITALATLPGCIIPQFTEFRPTPTAERLIPDSAGNPANVGAPITLNLKDATDKRPIDHASVLVLIHRNLYVGFCCSSQVVGREPVLHLEPFARLADLRYHDFNILVIFPLLYIGNTMPTHTYTSLIAYAPGYTPVPIQGTHASPPIVPTTILLKRCDPSQSRDALAAALSREMSADEEYDYGPALQSRLQHLLDQSE